MKENDQNTYFEPTLEDLELRRKDVLAAIEQDEAAQPDPDDVATLQFYQKGLKEAQAKQDERIREMARLEEDDEGRMGSTKSKTRAQKEGQITRDINKLRQHMANLETEIARLETSIQFHNTTKGVRVQYHRKRLARIDKQIEKLQKRERHGRAKHNTHGIQDFLQRVDENPGALGADQLRWLAETLDAHRKTPAVILVHHNPGEDNKIGGLKDTDALLEIIRPRPQVKAWVYGHTHNWKVTQDASGVHLVNLPPVAYIFREGDRLGASNSPGTVWRRETAGFSTGPSIARCQWPLPWPAVTATASRTHCAAWA